MELLNGCLSLVLAAADDAGTIESILATLLTILKVAVGLGLVIFVHELGHFLAAKAFDVQVDKFYVGFDVPLAIGPIRFPRTLGKFRRGETEYGIGIIPLGGYVKMLGQDDDPRKAAEEAERIRLRESEGAEGDVPDAPAQLHPRSYPAKNVFQRMVIISAGVIMNLIFAVIFAACAYGWGVPYTSPQLGWVVAGDPAAAAGVQPGGRVFGVNDHIDPNMHYLDMRTEIASHGLTDPQKPLQLHVDYGDATEVYSIVPTFAHRKDPEIATIGVAPAESRKLGGNMPAMPGTPAAEAFQEIAARNAEVLSFDGQTYPESDGPFLPTNLALQKYFSENADQPITLTLLPEDAEQPVTVEIPPQPYKTLGLRFDYGPIAAVVPGSPAEEAGIKAGDKIVAVNGQRDLSAMELWLLVNTASEPVELTMIVPHQSQETTKTVSLLEDRAPIPSMNFAGLLGLDRLGIAYPIQQTILVDSEANQTDLQSGDVLRKIIIDELDDEQLLDASPLLAKMLSEGIEIDDYYTPALIMYVSQSLPLGTELTAYFNRDGKTVKEDLAVELNEQYHWPTRGVEFEPVNEIHRAASIGEAVTLGFWETTRRMGDVLEFLGLLVTGRVPLDMVGGPVRIAQGAGIEASRSVTRLLLFLTLLSANLAILNFLPIPALDGGHMMFLIAEAVTGKPVDEQLQMRLTLVGILGLLMLMGFVIFNDVLQLIS